jgi:hypothetical protein
LGAGTSDELTVIVEEPVDGGTCKELGENCEGENRGLYDTTMGLNGNVLLFLETIVKIKNTKNNTKR